MGKKYASAVLIAVLLLGGFYFLFQALEKAPPPPESREGPSASGDRPEQPVPEKPSEVDRPPPGQGLLRVAARDRARNVPLAGAEILVRFRAGTRSETRAAIAGAGGEFRLALSPGSYSATFETEGYRPARAEFSLTEDSPVAAVEAAGHVEKVARLEWSRSMALPLVVEMRSSPTVNGGSHE